MIPFLAGLDRHVGHREVASMSCGAAPGRVLHRLLARAVDADRPMT
jgi:hypothetical protein